MKASFLLWALAVAAAGAAVAFTDLPYAFLNVSYWLLFAGGVVTLIAGTVLLAGAREARVPDLSGRWLLPAVLLSVFAVQYLATAWWPNSGDEYGYTFLARTLLHGRVFNPPPPLPELFRFNWIFVRDGKWFSQYPPGFPALLAPFLAAGMPFLLNPLLTVALAWLMRATLRQAGLAAANATALASLVAFAPFVLFNGASLYPHTLTAVALMAIILLQLRDEAAPGFARRVTIGALFGILLLTRYEVFAVAAVLFVAGRIWRRGAAAWTEFWPMALGGVPFALCFAAYNHAITGHFWLTPFSWASPGGGFGFHAMSDDGRNTPYVALRRTAEWACELMAYSSAAILLLWAAAFAAKLRARQIDWFDLIFPAAAAFFFLFAHAGGHRFGPRYWFFAWPPTLLTIATALPIEANWLRLRRLRLHIPTLAALHLPAYAAFALCVALYHSAYVSLRREVYDTQPPATPAIVLIPTRLLTLTPWQTKPTAAGSADFARNGVAFDAPVIYGRADNATHDQAAFTAMACSLGRHVYVWRAPGVLDRIECK